MVSKVTGVTTVTILLHSTPPCGYSTCGYSTCGYSACGTRFAKVKVLYQLASTEDVGLCFGLMPGSVLPPHAMHLQPNNFLISSTILVSTIKMRIQNYCPQTNG